MIFVKMPVRKAARSGNGAQNGRWLQTGGQPRALIKVLASSL